MNRIERIFYTVLNLPSCSTCRTSETIKRSINSRLPVRKNSVSSEMSRSFRLYLHFYWIFPRCLNKIKLKVACLNCTTKRTEAVICMGSHSTYQCTPFAENVCPFNLFNITPTLQPFSSCALLLSKNFFTH